MTWRQLPPGYANVTHNVTYKSRLEETTHYKQIVAIVIIVIIIKIIFTEFIVAL